MRSEQQTATRLAFTASVEKHCDAAISLEMFSFESWLSSDSQFDRERILKKWKPNRFATQMSCTMSENAFDGIFLHNSNESVHLNVNKMRGNWDQAQLQLQLRFLDRTIFSALMMRFSEFRVTDKSEGNFLRWTALKVKDGDFQTKPELWIIWIIGYHEYDIFDDKATASLNLIANGESQLSVIVEKRFTQRLQDSRQGESITLVWTSWSKCSGFLLCG